MISPLENYLIKGKTLYGFIWTKETLDDIINPPVKREEFESVEMIPNNNNSAENTAGTNTPSEGSFTLTIPQSPQPLSEEMIVLYNHLSKRQNTFELDNLLNQTNEMNSNNLNIINNIKPKTIHVFIFLYLFCICIYFVFVLLLYLYCICIVLYFLVFYIFIIEYIDSKYENRKFIS